METTKDKKEEGKDYTNVDAILVKESGTGEIKAVKGIENGNIQTVPAKKEFDNQFLKISKHDNILENFISNFISQVKNPTKFIFYKASAGNIEKEATEIRQALNNPSEKNKKLLESKSIPVPEVNNTRKKEFYIDPEKVNWDDMKKHFGITKEILEKMEVLDELLMGNKTSKLISLRAKFGENTIDMRGRLRFVKTDDESIKLKVHGVREKPELHRQFFGHTFSQEDEKNLMETGNMGRAVPLKDYINNKEELSLISIDPLTNETVAIKVSQVNIPDKLFGMTDKQVTDLKNGQTVFIKNLPTKLGEKPAYLQYNANKRGLEIKFPQQKQKVEISAKDIQEQSGKKDLKADNKQDADKKKDTKKRKGQKI